MLLHWILRFGCLESFPDTPDPQFSFCYNASLLMRVQAFLQIFCLMICAPLCEGTRRVTLCIQKENDGEEV